MLEYLDGGGVHQLSARASSAQAWRKHFRVNMAGVRVAQAVRKLPRKALGTVFENPGARKVAQAMRKSCVSEDWRAEGSRKRRVSFF